MQIYFAALIALIGLFIFLVTANPPKPDLKKVGEIMFWTGLLVFLFQLGTGVIKIP